MLIQVSNARHTSEPALLGFNVVCPELNRTAPIGRYRFRRSAGAGNGADTYDQLPSFSFVSVCLLCCWGRNKTNRSLPFPAQVIV